MRHEQLRLSVSPSNASGKMWQWLELRFGSHSTSRHEECLATWPREAIAKARAAIDEFEARLEGI